MYIFLIYLVGFMSMWYWGANDLHTDYKRNGKDPSDPHPLWFPFAISLIWPIVLPCVGAVMLWEKGLSKLGRGIKSILQRAFLGEADPHYPPRKP